jgi:hypothetical protein
MIRWNSPPRKTPTKTYRPRIYTKIFELANGQAMFWINCSRSSYTPEKRRRRCQETYFFGFVTRWDTKKKKIITRRYKAQSVESFTRSGLLPTRADHWQKRKKKPRTNSTKENEI